jgi:hypothetical protein
VSIGILLLSIGCGSNTPTGGGGGPIKTLVVNPSAPAVPVGGHQQLAVIAKDASGTVVTSPVLTWNSSNSSVVGVSSTGLLTGVAQGSATVSVASQGVADSATVLVSGAPLPGLALAFSTYLGGSVETSIRNVVTDASGNIYLAGGTSSPNFPTTAGAYQRTFGGIHDIIVAKLTPAGEVIWSTLIGGPNYDRAYSIAVDPQGNVYVAGRAGAGLPGTSGSFQPNFGGGSPQNSYGPQDGFVCKLSPDGSTLMWCSYFGTKDDRVIRDIVLDAQNNIFVAAAVDSATFPAAWFTHSYQKTWAGGSDDIVAKISNDGSQVIWASYIGGSANESGEPSIKVDASGSPVVLFITNSTDIPTPNGFDHTLSGTHDAYIAKFSSDGSALLYGTYLGGSGVESTETHELALDSQGNAIVASGTTSTDFPTTPGAYQRTYGGSGGPGTGKNTNYAGDAFVTKIAANGSQILASTYVGGVYGEQAEGVGVDTAGNVYITGATYSVNFPLSAHRFQATPGGHADGFLVKVSADLSQVLYSTYIGGSADDLGRDLAVDPFGNVIVGGMTYSNNWPTLVPFQAAPGGSISGVVAKFSPAP